MKKFCFFFSLLLLCGISAEELLRNGSFRENSAPGEAFVKRCASSGIQWKGRVFPRHWCVSAEKSGGSVNFEADQHTVFFRTGAEGMRFSMENYRISRRAVDGKNCRFTLCASGKGTVEVLMFCYNAKRKYHRTLHADKKIVFTGPETTGIAGLSCENLNPEVESIAFSFKISGDLAVKSIRCDAQKTATPQIDASWRSSSSAEKIARLESAPSLELAWVALRDKDELVRNRGAYILSQFGQAAYPARKELAERLMKDPLEAVRVHAAHALAYLGPQAYPELQSLLLTLPGRERLTLATAIRGRKGGVPAELKDAVDWANPPVALINTSLLPDGGFESSETGNLIGWQVQYIDGAEGRVEIDDARAHDGTQCLKITKTNGKGYILLKSRFPVTIPAGKGTRWTYRFYFQCFDSSWNTLLMPRLITPGGSMVSEDSSFLHGHAMESQSRLRNTPGHVWYRRGTMIGGRAGEQKFHPAIVFAGNPATVWIDDIQFPAATYVTHEAGPTATQPGYTLREALAIIAKRPAPSARVVREANGKCSFEINGKKAAPVLFRQSRPTGDHALMYQAGGVPLLVTVLSLEASPRYAPFFNGWDGKPITDYTPYLKSLEEAVRRVPQGNFLLGLNVSYPQNYVTMHPEDAWLDADGKKAFGNNNHVKGFADTPQPGMFFWPSQYSDRAREAAGDAFRVLLRALRKQPYAKIIVGSHISGGHDGQFAINRPDYSNSAKKAWHDFLRERYKTDAALRKAWHDNRVTIDTAPIPPPQPADIGKAILLDPAKHRRFSDFNEMREARVWQNSEYFARIFKEEMGQDKFVITWCIGGGWRKNFKVLLDSCYDGFVPQPSYSKRLPGLSGGINMASETYQRAGKLVISELDTRNWMRCRYNEIQDMWIGAPNNKREFQNLLLKEGGRQIARHHGFWLLDIGSNEYRHPAALDILHKAVKASDYAAGHIAEDKFAPGAALVFSQRSVFQDVQFKSHAGNFASEALNEMLYGLRRSGVPTANYFLEEMMKTGDWKKHRIFVFLNASFLTDPERSFIDRELKKNGNILVWIYAPGLLTEDGVMPAASEKLTGMSLAYDPAPRNYEVRLCPKSDPLATGLPLNLGAGDVRRKYFDLRNGDKPSSYWLPCFEITDPKAVVLGRYRNGKAALAVKRFADWTSVFCAAPGGLDAELMHNLAKTADVYAVTRPGVLCEVNDFFMSLHSCVSGKYEIRLPRHAAVVRDAMTGAVLGKETDRIRLELPVGKSVWLLLE